MARTFDPAEIIDLPRLDANEAHTLASALESAALDDDQKPITLPEAVQSALDEVKSDKAALLLVLGGTATTKPELRIIDRREDKAIRAVYKLCEAWEELAGEIPEGDIGRELVDRIFGDTGLGFINHRPVKEWAVVDAKLGVIDNEGLEPKFAALGATPMLAHLRKVHALYGEATGATKLKTPPESAQVREKRDTLLDSIRYYVGAVMGSVQRSKPATKTLADRLLSPLATWTPPAPRKAAEKPAEPPKQ